MEINKNVIVKMRDEINAVLVGVGKKYGVDLRCGNATFSETEINYKLIAKNTDQEIVNKKNQEDWDNNYELFGFQKDDLGKEFAGREGKKFKIVGFNLGRPKFNLRAMNLEDKKEYLFNGDEVSKILRRMEKFVTEMK